MLVNGEAKLRKHCGEEAPLKLTVSWAAYDARWMVRADFHPENHDKMLLGIEPLETFPSDELIATAMLVSQ